MNTKLTLSLEKTVIEKAKKYAKIKHRSLSEMVEEYLKEITKANKTGVFKEDLPPITKELSGILKNKPVLDYKKDITEYLENKYK